MRSWFAPGLAAAVVTTTIMLFDREQNLAGRAPLKP
jgi:hypothetical protein